MLDSNELQAREKTWPLGLFSGSALKYFAAALMVCDHLHQMFFQEAIWLTMLGRVVAPVFLFMCAEGFHYTRNRKRYLLQLFIGFWAMNAANFALGTALPMENIMLINNIFSTMFISALYILFWDRFTAGIKEKKAGKILGSLGLALLPVLSVVPVLLLMQGGGEVSRPVALAISFIPNVLVVEGGFAFVLLAVAFYALRGRRLLRMLPLALIGGLSFYTGLGTPGNIQWMMVFAAIPLLLYNGKRGRSGRFGKYFFYVFYPAHIYIMYLIAWALQR